MIFWDVNIWVYAFRSDSPLHQMARVEIESSLAAAEAFLFCPQVAASFLRLVTNPRIFREPSALEESWEFLDVLESHPRAQWRGVDPMTLGIFKHLSLVSHTVGNLVPDGLLAALAIRHDATFVTADAGFRRFQGLRLRLLNE